MSVNKRITLSICIILVIVAIAIGAVYMIRVNNYKSAVANITYSGIELSSIPDGLYLGECDVDFIRAKVEVVVAGGRIEEIRLLEHYNDRGEAATGLEQEIIHQQMIDVDAVSGATNSSRVIKKAVDNALQSALSINEHSK